MDDGTSRRSAMAAAVHEIRNPAVVIAGVVSLLLGRGTPGTTPGGAVHDDLLQALARQARLLDLATGDLLAAVQAEHGGPHVDARPVVLADVLAAAVADAPGREHVTVDCPPGLVVRADALRVRQMVHNLLSNAAKYGAPPVTVHAGPDDGRTEPGHAPTVRVVVTDAGPGVPEEVVPTVFEDFARAPGVDVPGTGLGLSVVRSLARAQGGRVWYEAGPSGGAVFAFTLPAVLPAQQGSPRLDVDALRAAP
jgi:signal transduction histidine kinase